MLRLFVAIELPEATRDRLGALRRPLPGATWVKPESMHLTLSFIGEVDEGLAADVDAELARISAPAFEIRIAGLGLFDSRDRARALWAGVERSPELMGLQAKVEGAVKRAGAQPDARRFLPHVTLARFRDAPVYQIAPFVARNNDYGDGPIFVDAVALMSSRLGREGAIYTAERHYPLLGAGIRALADEWSRSH